MPRDNTERKGVRAPIFWQPPWRKPNGPGEKTRAIRALILETLAAGWYTSLQLRGLCVLRLGYLVDISSMYRHLRTLERRGAITRERRCGEFGADIWSLPPPPAHLGDDVDVQSPSIQSKTKKATP